MPVEPTVVHTLGQQLTVQVEGGQDKKSGVTPRGVAFESQRNLVLLLEESRGRAGRARVGLLEGDPEPG